MPKKKKKVEFEEKREEFLWEVHQSPVFPTRTTWRHNEVSYFQNTTTALWFRGSILSVSSSEENAGPENARGPLLDDGSCSAGSLPAAAPAWEPMCGHSQTEVRSFFWV